MELGGVFEKSSWRKKISKSKPFLINTTQWFGTDSQEALSRKALIFHFR